MTTHAILPVEKILDIVRQVVSKYRRRNHPDYEDFVQDILLGVFERTVDYDPARGKAEKYVISVANQKARDRHREERRYREQATTNHRSRVPYRVKIREVGEADRCGRLQYDDPVLRLSQVRQRLDAEQSRFLELLRSGYDRSDIERKMKIDSTQSHEIALTLQKIFGSKSSSEKIFHASR